jgi:hypothetical protein
LPFPAVHKFVVTLVAVTISAAAAASDPGPPELALEPGIWEGTLECGRGTAYVTLSVDIHPYTAKTTQAAGRMDLADSPGGPPFARGQMLINHFSGKAQLRVRPWVFRPMDTAEFPGDYPAELTVSADRQTMTAPTFGACKQLRLTRLAAARASGGIASAADLPPAFEGMFTCTNGQAMYNLRLQLTPTGKTDFDGQVLIQPVGDPSRSSIASYEIFGEFDPANAELTVIADRWIKKSRQLRTALDFSGVIRQTGQRLVGEGPTSLGACRTLDLHVPGTDQTTLITMPSPALPPEQWDTPSGCATLSHWARQSLLENNGRTVYNSVTSARAHEIGIGLFADERFVPYFTMPFAELSAAQRQHVLDVADACRFQTYSASEIYESGANTFTGGFFPDRTSGEWLKLKRYNLKRKRLAGEMAELEAQAVGESDIRPLQARMAEIPERYAGLWQSDLAAAKNLIAAKIDTAKGAMIDRLNNEIDALPVAWEAFGPSRRIRSQIPALGQDRRADQAQLNARLDRKLGEAADAVLAGIVARFADRSPSLNALQDLRQHVELRWAVLNPYVSTRAPGFKALDDAFATLAQANFASFKSKTANMIDESAHFDHRMSQHSRATNYYLSVVPTSKLFSATFQPYVNHIDSLRPVPTERDLVADDGSPTDLGLRFAVAAWVKDTYALVNAVLPIDISVLTNKIRVSDVRKDGCATADKGGYWCNFRVTIRGIPIFAAAMSYIPSEARFAFSRMSWNVVETPPRQAPVATGSNNPWDNPYQKRMTELSEMGMQMPP